MKYWAPLLCVLAAGTYGTRLFTAPQKDHIVVGGPASNTVTLAWNAVQCPTSGGRATGITFISWGAVAGVGSARAILENNLPDGGKVEMCRLDVPCQTPLYDTVQTDLRDCDGSPTCAPGDVVHIEWTSNECTLNPPSGAGTGTVEAL